jgi:ankyrin repeat protein
MKSLICLFTFTSLLLLGNFARANSATDNPILLSLDDKDLDKAKAIIEADPNAVNARNKDGFTPLAKIANEKHWDLSLGGKFQGAMKKDDTTASTVPLVAELLIAKGADVNAKDTRDGGTPLIWAIIRGKLAFAEFLITKGADINAKDKHGTTPLMWAIVEGTPAFANVLIQKGADVNGKGISGTTPLMLASSSGYRELVQVLLAKGAEINARTIAGSTALTAAMEGRHPEIRAILEQAGAKP